MIMEALLLHSNKENRKEKEEEKKPEKEKYRQIKCSPNLPNQDNEYLVHGQQ
jgi:hypothetical protein